MFLAFVPRTLQLTPPDGEFAIMNFRSTSEFRPPFYLHTSVEEMTPYKVEVLVKLKADFPPDKKASTLQVKIPLPATVSKCAAGGPGSCWHAPTA